MGEQPMVLEDEPDPRASGVSRVPVAVSSNTAPSTST